MAKISLYILLLVLLFGSISYSHPPLRITAEFEPVDRKLSLVISHYVNNPREHYVERVIIERQGIKIIEQYFTSQTDNENQIVSYIVRDLSEGDFILIKAYCNTQGQLTERVLLGGD